MSPGHRPRKRFGQHFLADASVVDSIVDAIAPRPGDTLVEIGPGQGALTAPLIRSGAAIHGVEFDRDLAAALRERWREAANFVLHEADALRFDVRTLGTDLRIAGNLPYNISTPLLFHLLEAVDRIRDMHFMLQKEVVDRMAAEPGSKRYGRLTVMLGCAAEVEQLFEVPPGAFSPPPKVVSSVVRITPRGDARLPVRDAATLQRIVSAGFSQRRKTLRNALRQEARPEVLEACGIDPGARAETVPVAGWVALANRLAPP